MVSLRAAEVTISHKKSHQRRFCRDQEYLRLRALNRAKRTLPARDSSRNACCLLPLRGVKTAASTRGIIHRREISSASNRDESSCGSGEERARHPSRFWFSAPSFPSVPQPLDLGYVLRQERSSGHQWRETVKESACHQLDQFETLYEETCALKQPRTLAGTSASSPESPCINPLLSLSLSLSLFLWFFFRTQLIGNWLGQQGKTHGSVPPICDARTSLIDRRDNENIGELPAARLLASAPSCRDNNYELCCVIRSTSAEI